MLYQYIFKAQDSNSSPQNWVYEKDYRCFSENEKKYLHPFLKDLEDLKIYMRGTNNVLGQNI